jgi:hypothetical protein
MIKDILKKHGHSDQETNDHYLSVLETFPQNEWFAPTDKNNDEFTICYWFASRGMICEKRIPNFHNGSYVGLTKYYLWNENLNYKNL